MLIIYILEHFIIITFFKINYVYFTDDVIEENVIVIKRFEI